MVNKNDGVDIWGGLSLKEESTHDEGNNHEEALQRIENCHMECITILFKSIVPGDRRLLGVRSNKTTVRWYGGVI